MPSSALRLPAVLRNDGSGTSNGSVMKRLRKALPFASSVLVSCFTNKNCVMLLRRRDLVFLRDIFSSSDHRMGAERIVIKIVKHPISPPPPYRRGRGIGDNKICGLLICSVAGYSKRRRGDTGLHLLCGRQQGPDACRTCLHNGGTGNMSERPAKLAQPWHSIERMSL